MSAATDPQRAPDSAPEMVVTFFTDALARTKKEERLSLGILAERINKVSRPTKSQLPWLKCARFGDIKTDKNSLRHDGNVIGITGIEGDYDAKEVNGRTISFDEAIEIIGNAGLCALLYTSPSYTEYFQKWRALCPLSDEYAPEDRDRFMARLNGLFEGGFSSESWTLSQSYYYGSTNSPSHRVVWLDGTVIDKAHYLDQGAIGKPQKSRPDSGAQDNQKARPKDITDKRIRGLVEALLDNVRSARDGEKYFTLRDIGYTFGGYLNVIGWTIDQAVEALIDALPDTVEDWKAAKATARKAVEAGKDKPLDLEERQNQKAEKSPLRPPESEDAKPQKPPRAGRILTGAQFIKRHVPPVWLIDGIVQRSRLYACTSITGHGKTAVWLFNGCMIHAGRVIGNLEIFKGNVLFLAGENPCDLEARAIGMARTYNLRDDELPYVLPGSFPLTEEEAEALKREIDALGVPLSLIVGDTASSFFPGDDENSNVQSGAYARTLRTFSECRGSPAIVALCHPTKGADRKNLLPRGGGAFLNELDGNLTLHSPSQGEITELHWWGKIRGPDFSPLGYRLRQVPTDLIDEKGRPEMTVVAEPMSEEAVADATKQATANEDVVLRALRDNPDWTFAEIARNAGWVDGDDRPERWRVQRALSSLADDKMVIQKRKRGPWTLTDKGEDALKDAR